MDSHHRRTHEQARMHDVALVFFQVRAGGDALAERAARHGRGPMRSVLALAAGPARHALDQARTQGVVLQAVDADRVDVQPGVRFDLAVLLMVSASTRLANDDDAFDPITPIDAVRVQWSGRDGDGNGDGELTETAHQRRCTVNEFDALGRASGCFETVACFAALDVAVPLDNARAAGRRVPVPRKTKPAP